MNRAVFLVTLLMAVLAGSAMAGSAGDRIGDSTGELSTYLTNQLFMGSDPGGSDTWQEVHCQNGDIFELAKGAGDPVDPSKVVGSWRIIDIGVSGSASNPGSGTVDEIVCYRYGITGEEYCFRVFENSGTYEFYTTRPGEALKATGEIVSYEGTCP